MAVLASDAASANLSSLGWVLEEIRESLGAASQVCHRHLREIHKSGSARREPAPLHAARQRVHQSVGALEMVGLDGPAQLLRAVEAALLRLMEQPEHFDESALAAIDQAGHAVLDFLEAALRGHFASALHLFPQYQAVQGVAGAERVHPADLWDFNWAWTDPDTPTPAMPLFYEPAVRAQLDALILRIVKGGEPEAAQALSETALALSASQSGQPRIFWKLVAACFEAVARQRLPVDVYLKRAASRVLVQCGALARGEDRVPDSLARELLFFCAQAQVGGDDAPVLRAVHAAWGLSGAVPVDYTTPRFGRHDPALLEQVRTRLAVAKARWSALTEGETTALGTLAESFQGLGEGLSRLLPASAALAQTLTAAAQAVVQGHTAPSPELAMEVATALIYLEVALQDLDSEETELPDRLDRLASRVSAAATGQAGAPLEPWIEAVYRRVSDRHTMGTVVGEVRQVLGQLESALGEFCRGASESAPLVGVAAQLGQVRGVLDVLGLDAAVRAAQRMQQDVEALSRGSATDDDPAAAELLDRLAHNLGALGFLIDMLGQQPALARRLFTYDVVRGQLQVPNSPRSSPTAELQPELPPSEPLQANAIPASAGTPADLADDHEDLRSIFLGEAAGVIATGTQAIAELRRAPDAVESLAALRRAFHTLKGSARMVDLRELGEAAWAMEQVLNTWLADQQPASPALLELALDALGHLLDWVDDVATGHDVDRCAAPFHAAAEALRAHGEHVLISAPGMAVPVVNPVTEPTEAKPELEPELLELVPSAEKPADDEFRCIGELRVPIPLFNVFLSEADEWSRRLLTALEEWHLDPRHAMPPESIGLAHALAGSSATLGFAGLAELARALEHALDRARQGDLHDPARAGLFAEAAERVRWLLHQFAAGFLHAPAPDLLSRLAQRGKPSDVARTDEPDLEAEDGIDPDLFPVFESEALELMPRLTGALRQWAQSPDDLAARDAALRVLHTLKGSARLAGALRLGERAHRLESQAEALGREAINPVDIEALLQQADALQTTLDRLRDPASVGAVIQSIPDGDVRGRASVRVQDDRFPARTTGASPVPAGAARPVTLALSQTTHANAVRVRSELLERMLDQAGEVMITRGRLEAELAQLRGSLRDLGGNIDRLRGQLREMELQAETQVQSRMAQAGDSAAQFDPLEFDRYTRVQELTRMMAESVSDVATIQRTLERTVDATEDDLASQARQARELQRNLLRTRMVEFDALSERLYRVVRQAAKEEGKQVRLDVEGGRIELDRSVLDRVVPAFEHLLRNAVVHGIESPSQRLAAAKDPVGRIGIALRQDGNEVAVEVTDDGAGLDVARIRARAEALGLVTTGSALDETEVAQLIFEPGLSTAERLSDLAGRGIGMDVVRAELAALGGRIDTTSEAGRGTRFLLVLPLTTAVTQVVLVRMGALTIGTPANLIERVIRTPRAVLAEAHERGMLNVAGEALPFHWGGALLRASPASAETLSSTVPVVLLRSAALRVALQVDEVLGNREVVVKNLGPQLSRMPGLTGMSLLPDGDVVLIYNPVALAQVYGGAARAWVSGHAAAGVSSSAEPTNDVASLALPAEATPPLVMVVDDSITVRRVTQRLLAREGYRVALAADGLQALEMLAGEVPALLLSDIEMPRMDGFDLLRNIRRQPRLAELPVVMITSRTAAKHRDHAMALGATHYLGKPYAEEELLDLLKQHITASVQGTA